MIGIFFNALVVGYSGAVMPGALLTYVINQSLKKGIKVGVLTIIGHALLETVLIVLIFLGLSSVLESNLMSIIISFAGGALMIFFGVSGVLEVVRGKFKVEVDDQAKADSDGKLIVAGGLVSLANPYFIIWWATIGLALLFKAHAAFGYIGVVVFALGHFMADFSWYVLISGAVHKTKGFLNLKAYRALAFVLSLALVGFGIYYMFSGMKFTGII
ncbi:MAG: LysE family transporter [Eubacteriales bacterium]